MRDLLFCMLSLIKKYEEEGKKQKLFLFFKSESIFYLINIRKIQFITIFPISMKMR